MILYADLMNEFKRRGIKKAVDILSRMREIQAELHNGATYQIVGLNETGDEFRVPVNFDRREAFGDNGSWVEGLEQDDKRLKVLAYIIEGVPAHYHVMPETIYVTEGEVEIKMGRTKKECMSSKPKVLREGEHIKVPALTWHEITTTTAKLIVSWIID
jgi:mannose-6-phosphate isomerase-like protein (cupin superfamily)